MWCSGKQRGGLRVKGQRREDMGAQLKREDMKKEVRFLSAVLVISALLVGLLIQLPVCVQAKSVSCKSLCRAALLKTGGADNLKYQSEKASDFGGFSVSEREKVSSILYACDEAEVYSICVVKAASRSDAADVLKYFKAYKTRNTGSSYLQDYSSAQQDVFKNAVCGRKGKYAWYIAMSTSKSDNKNGQKAIKKKI